MLNGPCGSAAVLRAAAEYAALVASTHGWLTPRMAAPAASALGLCGAMPSSATCAGTSGSASEASGLSFMRHHSNIAGLIQRTICDRSSSSGSNVAAWRLEVVVPGHRDSAAARAQSPPASTQTIPISAAVHAWQLPTGETPHFNASSAAGGALPGWGSAAPGQNPTPQQQSPLTGTLLSTRRHFGSLPGVRPTATSPGTPRRTMGLLVRHFSRSSATAAAAAADSPASPPSQPLPQSRQAGQATQPQAQSQPPQQQGQLGQQQQPDKDKDKAAAGAVVPRGFVGGGYDVSAFPPERIRNFSIIAHVDHGKSTLADRMLEMTGALGARATHNAQYLDKLQVERERGITVKAQTVSLVYHHQGDPYLLNLIDTPGHVDFSYEVSRSLAACQGALLVVDAGQGIQAQTVANFYLAFEQGLDLIPVVNKIDLPAADPVGCAEQMAAAFDMDPQRVLATSAKTGQGMGAVMPAVIERIRPPRGNPSGPLRMLLFDAFHDEYRGVVVLVEVVDGQVAVGQRVVLASNGAVYEVQEVGVQAPERHPTGRLLTGQVGYLMCGIKDLKAARVGDTLYAAPQPGMPAPPQPPRLPGFKPAKAMVFAGLFPLGGDGQEFDSLAAAMDKLLLNDASVVMRRENSDALGPGFRCGFLGMLHMEIFTQRLEQEFGASVVTTTPMVPYILEFADESTVTLESAAEFPVDKKISTILEPTVTATLITPDATVGRLMELCAGRRGEQLEHTAVGGGRSMLRYRLPLAELAGDFYSTVKSRSQGYASFDYEEGPYRPADLVRLDILAHGQVVDALARMVHRDDAATVGRALVAKMKELLDRQQFEVVLQAAANGKVVARETIKALRKNVTAKCYGGDISRKRKLLDRQKEGKRRMKRLGSIDVPQELFPELMKTR